ncbi:MAG: sugar phosphate isomerase/epimerase [Bacteroidetes bacterium]|nr:MAG: sugar phosphate isomerase/epimerase [Bacteroidota bacterium]
MPTRRVFLKQASLASAAALMNPIRLFAANKLIGIQLYTLREEANKDIKNTIAKIAQVGYNSVEIFNYKDGKYFGLSPEDFAAIFKANNLKTPSGHYSLPNYLLKGDEDELKRTVADSVKMSHAFFTIPYLTENLRTSLDDYKRLADRLNRAAEVVKPTGMRLAYHNHDFEFKDWGNGQTGYEILQKQTDPSQVNFEMDIYWITKAGKDPIEMIKANPGRIKMWHIKDMDSTPEKSFTEVGSGIINYKEIFKHQKESGLEYFFVEQDRVKMPVYESISKSYEYVKNNILG